MLRRIRSALGRWVREGIVEPALPTSVTFGPNRNDRIGALHRAWGHIFTNQIRGAYYEFGVYRGDTFRASHGVYENYLRWLKGQLKSPESWRNEAAAAYADYSHHFYAFDTFQGMPANDEANISFSQGSFSFSVEEFDRLNQAQGLVRSEAIRYFVGTFAEVMNSSSPELDELEPAAIVNLDSDLYESARDALSIVGPKLVQGSVLLADDWNAFSASRSKGERKAVAEFLAQHPELALESWFPYLYGGQAFLVHSDIRQAL